MNGALRAAAALLIAAFVPAVAQAGVRGITGIALTDRPSGLDGYDDDYDEYFKNFILTPDGRIVNFDPIAAHGW
ncbi:MAG: hypothetical protein V3S11_04160 [Elusimicrobiota bacterium]